MPVKEYVQKASAVSTIRHIIHDYPLSAGILREIIQNSDDAGASKQIFVLDQQNHSTEGLYSAGLAATQGPSLLAFNDGVLSEKDWDALSDIHDSSKAADDSKIGKYGTGFRTVFHLTDSPQIVSDKYLAIFDPLCLHLGSEGIQGDLGEISSTLPNQLSSFGFFMKDGPTIPFPGTVIRCPLRNLPSGISERAIKTTDISEIFDDFIDRELEISCIFLNNIKTIEIFKVAATGASSLLAKLTVSRVVVHSIMSTVTVEITGKDTIKKEWHVIEPNFSRDEAANILLQRPGYNSSSVDFIFRSAKLLPDVKIAVDVTSRIQGRLFTYLPLPISTGLPVHIHSLFAIDSSREQLRRAAVGLLSGSQDHAKVQWNRMLFDIFIPRTWGLLLQEVISKELVSDVFSIWPPERSSGEIEPYYPGLLQQLVDTLLAAKAAVWPVYEPNQSVQFKSLEELVVASPTERECVLKALAGVGVPFTRPPKYIFDLLRNSSENTSTLSPDVAHKLLLDKVDRITHASEVDQALLLEYLLSTKNVLNICDLPLVPVINGEKVKLSNVPGVPVYSILTGRDVDIFGPCDDFAIPLYPLRSQVAATLLESGPGSVNVERPAVPRIVEYLSVYSNRLDSCHSDGRLDSGAVRWLSNFWEWLDAYEHKGELFPQIRNLLLLPSMKGLRMADSALFKLRGEHPTYTTGYLALGVPFLSNRDFSDTAHRVLQRYDLVISISNISTLLDALPSTCPVELPRPDCEGVLKHLSSMLDESVGQERIQRLRKLPIFPVLSCAMTGNSSSPVTEWSAIPEDHSIRSVGTRARFVPLVAGISFVGLESIAPGLVKFLEPTHPDPTSDHDLIELAVENLTTQPEHLQLSIIRHITDNRTRIVQDVFSKLSRQAFVLAEDDVYRVPGDIVDPESDVSQLYIGCPAHQPVRTGSFCMEILRCLRLLKLLRAQLNLEIVAERVEYISTRHTTEEALSIARNLLRILGSSNVDFSQVQGISEKKWLPTNRGLCSAAECRHAAVTPLAQFDQVLATVEPSFVPPALQTVLRWGEPLPIDVLIRQLDCTLSSEHSSYDVVVEIVKEFGRRQWSSEDFGSLKATVGDRRWIPTVTTGVLADNKSSVFNFSPTMINSGFHQIRSDLGAEDFLRQMGCTDRPSISAIIDKLHSATRDSNPADPVGLVSSSISLLQSIPDDFDTTRRAEFLIPDKDAHLRSFSETFYNDIGENHRLVRGDGIFIAHHLVDESLARKLGLKRLGLQYAEFRNLGPNLGQPPVITVRHTLKQYTDQQFLLEFLANAEDAKATEFKVAVNLATVREEQDSSLLSLDTMKYLCNLPSLVVYNNALFTEKDFDGICHTGVGGKEGRADTIGEFGLGVLTMFHFTDLAMVISGSKVLFLDPLKKHLPGTDCAISLPLQRVQGWYKNHIVALDGVFGFDMAVNSYNGTLFVLPLRGSDGTDRPSIIQDIWSPELIFSKILDPFAKIAGGSLLFTGIQKIDCITRAHNGAVTPHWSFSARKIPIMGLESEYAVTDVEITKSTDSLELLEPWKTVTTSRMRNQLPLEFQGHDSLTRKPTFAGLAARVDSLSSDDYSFKFFSRLPLSTSTTLPMHVMASFVLASDRRQIRLDNLEELQTKYNTWLLEEVVPPLYLFFLEHLLHCQVAHYRLRWPSNKGDTISNHVVNSFYSAKHLASSTRKLFASKYSDRVLKPQEVVLEVNGSHNIHRIIDLLAPNEVVDLPAGPRELVAERAKLATVDPDFVRKQILCKPDVITNSNNLFETVRDIILYLSQKDDIDILCGLPILPLENDSFGTLDTRKDFRGTGKSYYYLWRPKADQNRAHNFDESRFVHPKMRTGDLEKFKLNFSLLNPSVIKHFITDKVSTFSSQDVISDIQTRWVDSFWDTWEEYTHLGLQLDDILSFPLVPMSLQWESSFKMFTLEQCMNGEVLLMDGDSPEIRGLRNCLRALGLHVVYVDGRPIPDALCGILKDQQKFPRMKLETVLLAIEKSNRPILELFGSLDDELKNVFAEWARKKVSEISDDQMILAQNLPIWWSAGGKASRILRPRSEVQLLPENVTLEDVAVLMGPCVADDAALTHLKVQRMTLNELRDHLRLPDVLDDETLDQYKRFYEKWATTLPTACNQPLLVPTGANTLRDPNELYKREPLFTAVFPEDSPFFVHPAFEEFEKKLSGFELRSEQSLDMDLFITCALRLTANGPAVVPHAEQVFRAFRDILPNRVVKQPHAWRELDAIPFIPRRMDTMRKLAHLDENEPGFEIPPEVTGLDAVVQPVKVVRAEFEAIVWSQRACFELQPDQRVYDEYPDLGRPSFSEVIAHLRYLSRLSSQCASQSRLLLHDVTAVYKYLDEKLVGNEELAPALLFALRDEPLLLNIDGEEDCLHWVRGNSLVIDRYHREGGVLALLRPFEGILKAVKVQHPSYTLDHDSLHFESRICSKFNQLRKKRILTDVEFLVEPTEDVPDPEPLFAHQSFLAASSEFLGDYFSQKSQHACVDCPLVIGPVPYSWRCVRSFLEFIYTRSKGGNDFPLELLLELLDASNKYKILDLFDEVQGEIAERRLLTPDNVDKIKAEAEKQQAKSLMKACGEYEATNGEVKSLES